jgi:sugar O-acyltransferase (sialic acid O-acetyltransferase NeuD family)
MSDVVIFGVGDFARTARIYLEADSDHGVVAFTVHERYIEESSLDGVAVVPFESLAESHPPDRFAMFVAIGFSRVNEARREVYDECKTLGYDLISYVNSKAIHWGELELGDNCFVFEANVIQPNVRIGNNVILWSGNHIGHDSTIEDHCFIASHVVVSGNVTIGRSSFVGVNATFRDGIAVAPRCIIGANALIMKDTQEGEVYSVRGTEPLDKKSWDLNF